MGGAINLRTVIRGDIRSPALFARGVVAGELNSEQIALVEVALEAESSEHSKNLAYLLGMVRAGRFQSGEALRDVERTIAALARSTIRFNDEDAVQRVAALLVSKEPARSGASMYVGDSGYRRPPAMDRTKKRDVSAMSSAEPPVTSGVLAEAIPVPKIKVNGRDVEVRQGLEGLQDGISDAAWKLLAGLTFKNGWLARLWNLGFGKLSIQSERGVAITMKTRASRRWGRPDILVLEVQAPSKAASFDLMDKAFKNLTKETSDFISLAHYHNLSLMQAGERGPFVSQPRSDGASLSLEKGNIWEEGGNNIHLSVSLPPRKVGGWGNYNALLHSFFEAFREPLGYPEPFRGGYLRGHGRGEVPGNVRN